ncbi:glycosyltransferase [Neolewinella persica]|uniref:glycosyltransferase n=1 Tax=Neolewinella persica TaxID=70998 RepID=UPI000362E1EF|nr:glycosyltransferase [Neolewinella persica]
MHTHLLARELVARGHEVTLFAHPGSDQQFNLAPIAVKENAGFLTYTRAIRKAIRFADLGDYDAIHNNTIHFLPPLLAQGLGIPMVTTLHTPPYKSHRLTAGLTKQVPNHHYVAISHFLGRQWQPFIGDDYTVIHNGLDPDAWPFSATPAPGTAIWYGRFTPEKGAEYAIAAARAAGCRLTLAGPISDQHYFDSLVAPELDERIRYAGHLKQAELAELVGRSAVGIVTSVWDEPFGLVFAEMLACGTPVVGFDSGAAVEIVTPEVGALVAKYDVRALTQVLEEVEGSRVRQHCRKRVLDAFQVERMVAEYESLYRRLISLT